MFTIICRIVMFVISCKYVCTIGETSKRNYWTKGLESESRSGERYLVYPTPQPGAPTKVQLITGLGLPMEVDVSMIVGYVMKFNYVLPYNASYLAHPGVSGYDRSIDRRYPHVDRQKKNNDDDGDEIQEGRDVVVSPTRWEIYRLVESTLEGLRVSGKGCLLRIICHLAELPFDNPNSGLFAELVHVLLTPSTTQERYETIGDQEYHTAESTGRDNPGMCEKFFAECHHDILEYFTEIIAFEEQT